MSLPSPVKPPVPVPAAQALKTTPSPIKAVSTKPSKKFNKKLLLIIFLPFIGLIVLAMAFKIFQSINKPQKPSPTPTPTPIEAPTGGSPTPIPFDAPDDIPDSVPTETTDPNWQRFINPQGGYYYDLPANFIIKPSNDSYDNWHPAWYDPSHYFDCINRQVGSTKPFPCHLIQIYFTTADPLTISDLAPESGKISSFPGTLHDYQDGLGRSWIIKGPIEQTNSHSYFAEIEINKILYQLETNVIDRSMRQYLRNHSDRPFAKNINNTEPESIKQAHLNLLHQMLTTFQVFRNSYVVEPTWLRHRFSDNWSVAYPENWQIYSAEEASLPSEAEGLLEGWYGTKKTVDFHKYSILLITPNMDQYPPTASLKIRDWLDFELALLSTEEQAQVKIVGIPKKKGRRKKKIVTYATRTMLNIPNNISLITDTHVADNPAHKTLIWELEDSPRIVIIRQIDGAYEPESMQKLLNLFIKRIYE